MSRISDSVSVVLATFNGERYLARQLESLTTQVVGPMELVVGDDGSTDSTAEIVEDFARQAPFRVRLVRRNRLGYANNFVATARIASGSLVAFCDQDDIWHPNKLKRVIETFSASSQIVLVAHHANVVDSEEVPLGRTFPRPTRAGYYNCGSLPIVQYPGFTLSVRRWILESADPDGRPDEGDERAGLMSHDIWTWMLAACLGDAVILSDRLVSYRLHQNLFGDLHVAPRERLRRAIEADSHTYDNRAAREVTIAEYLERLAYEWTSRGHSDWAIAARYRADRHRRQARYASDRADLYRSPSRRTAATRMTRMVASRIYTSPDGGVAWRSVLKDVVRLPFGFNAGGHGH
jgi:glycosyltransferase involved in cell wall biosynthesis